MRGAGRAPLLLWCAVSWWAPAGCLDAGPPPRGRHLLAGRDADSVQLVAGPAGAPTRILLSQLQNEGGVPGFTTQRLSTVDDPGQGGAAAASRELLDHVGQVLQNCSVTGCSLLVDALGRLYLDRVSFSPSTEFPGSINQTNELVRVDPATGAQQSFGVVSLAEISPTGTRIALLQPDAQMQSHWTILDLDDRQTTLPNVWIGFVGDDLFLLSFEGDGALMHLPAGSATPQMVAAGIWDLSFLDTERGPLLLLVRSTSPDRSDALTSLLDPTTLVETALPPATAMADTFVPSPDGRYLIAQPSGRGGPTMEPLATLFDRDTGEESTASVPWFLSPPVWRPRHEEAWFLGGDNNLWRWQPGQAPVIVADGVSSQFYLPALSSATQELAYNGAPIFTPDGSFWLMASAQTEHPPVSLQSADDAAIPPLLLNPEGTGVAGLWPLPDGRLLVEAWITDVKRNDVYLVDPPARTAQPLASTGNIVATGRDRCLALLHWVAAGGSGDLTSIDYATGTQTLIAQNVHGVVVDASPAPGDALAPGTRIVYLVRNRIASPYDGVWAIELP